MPVNEIAKTTKPEPNTVYVQPPNKCVIVQDGALVLVGRTQHVNVAIDQFFESLAEACGSRGIGVLLSGTGSDGTAGLRAIKVAGGLTFAQDEQTAKFAEMPRNAIRSGFVDAVRSPREIEREIRHIVEHPYIRRSAESKSERAAKLDYQKADDLGRIFLSLKKQMGIDFTGYKLETLNRRIQRRMALHRMTKLSQYARFLRNNKKEIEALFDDLLINVTRFFRDSSLFTALRKRFLPAILKNKHRQDELRAWVPGCATGEEVYSIAICILETLGKRASELRIQIFGTDLSEAMFDELFDLVEKKNKIYTKKMVATPRPELAAYEGARFAPSAVRSTTVEAATFGEQLVRAADHIMLNAYAPAGVVIDHDLRVHQFRGRTEFYLQHHPGPATLNLLQIVRPSLAADLRNVVRRAIKANKPARTERSVIKHNRKAREINIQVVPFKIPGTDKPWLLVIFDETTGEAKPGKAQQFLGKTASQREFTELRRELAVSKESLQAIIEEQEATNEELKSANEEIESSNEELQSTNEELETAKEELQSTNEELTTLNEELSNRNLETMQMNSDLKNLLASIQLPIVMVDNELLVRRVTPAARNVFNVLQSDVGRPISDFKPNIDIPDLEELLREVIETLAMRERRVTDRGGREYSLRVRPYRTTENKIDGAVITLVDINGEGEQEADGNKATKRTKQISPQK